ncbi:MAG: MarR family transcriptional regulator [Boseongicola sp.]|nr:MarR family transcriptional regulator [Boseongicola sp.]NNJ67368.1 MarR family transcriptional regulator [Boseongicola sp.]
MPVNMETVDCICTNLRTAALAGTEFYDARLRPSGLKVTMFRLMRQIQRTPNATLTLLASRMGLDRSTLGRNVRVLERQGLVAVTTGEDERSKELFLTSEGICALEVALPLWEKAQADMSAVLGSETDDLIEILRGISKLSHPDSEKGANHDR